MRNLPEREQLEKWSQQWEQIKQFMVLESQIERTKENMEAKASLPSDVQSSKHEDHSGLIADQEDNETARNEKNSDSGNLTHEQSGESVLEKQGLFHQEEPAHSERNTAEADVEKLETGHAAISQVIEHETSPLRKQLYIALVNIGLVPPWVDTQGESGQLLTGDHVLIPQTLHLLDNLLLTESFIINRYQAWGRSPLKELTIALRNVENASPWFSGVTEERDDNSCVSPLSQVLFDHRASPPDVKSRVYQSALDEYVEALTGYLLGQRQAHLTLFKINESLSEKEHATAEIKATIRNWLGSMASESSDECSLDAIDAEINIKLNGFVFQVSSANFFTQSPTAARIGNFSIEQSVRMCIASCNHVKQAESYEKSYRDDCYTLAFHRADTISEEELYAIFEREYLKGRLAVRYLLISAASVSMIHKVYSMRFDYGSQYEGMIDTLMILACALGDNKAVKKMIDARVDVNTGQSEVNTGLMHACWRGHTTVVSILLKAGANVDAKNKEGYTGLMWACERGHEAIVEKLIKAGADFSVADNIGQTALMMASARGHEAVVEKLIKAGADFSVADNSGKTALMHACMMRDDAMASIRRKGGAIMNAGGHDGETALMEACRKDHNRIVKQLLDAGADIYSVDNIGETVFDFALRRGTTEMITMLENARFSADDTASSAFSP